MGAKIVVVTCGEKGASLYTEYGVIHSPAVKVNAVDTTGAEDSFAAGFIAAYIKEKKLKECLNYTNLVASYCVRNRGFKYSVIST